MAANQHPDRQAKLATALRQNLKRRKAGARDGDAGGQPPSRGHESDVIAPHEESPKLGSKRSY